MHRTRAVYFSNAFDKLVQKKI